MNKLPCEVVQDLLPSYIDHLTKEVTNQYVEAHLEKCEKCRALHQSMTGGPDASVPAEEDKREIDFLKKNRRRNIRIALIALGTAAVLFGAALFLRLYVIGEKLYGDWITCEVQVEGNRLIVDGTPVESAHAVSKITVETDEEKGVIRLLTNAVLASPLRHGSFHTECSLGSEIRRVIINDRILWDEGENISSLSSAVFQSRHEYIGDMSANNWTANVLSISEVLGPFSNELETGEAPYGWKLLLEEDLPKEEQVRKEKDMEAIARVLMAVIKNLDRVTFVYGVEGQSLTKTITSEDASAYFGQNIKDCYESPRLLNTLIARDRMYY